MAQQLLFVIVLLVAQLGFANAYQEEQEDIAELRDLIERQAELKPQTDLQLNDAEWEVIADNVTAPIATFSTLSNECIEADFKIMQKYYAISFNDEGRMCKIYDLSFPHLKLLFGKNKSSNSPVKLMDFTTKKFSVKEITQALRGDPQAAMNSHERFKKLPLSQARKSQAKWVRHLRFKRNFQFGTMVALDGRPVPKRFLASDLDIGPIQFSHHQKSALSKVVASLYGLDNSPAGQKKLQAWQALIEKPDTILSKIKFDWDVVKKGYKVFLMGEFLPINGPISLVDTSMPYRPFTEKLLRNLFAKAFVTATKLVPPPYYGLVNFLVAESFYMIDGLYTYQYNRFEAALVAESQNKRSQIAAVNMETAMNVRFLDEFDIVSDFILRMSRGEDFPWNKLELIGKRQRYLSVQSRDNKIALNNNKLVRNMGCKGEIVHSYFSKCERSVRGRSHVKVYNLLTDFNIFGYEFKPQVTYDYKSPYGNLLKRSIFYILAGVGSLADLPIPGWMAGFIVDTMRDYALTGIDKEGYLLGSISSSESAEDIKMRNVLLLQNINPFTAWSVKHENRILEKNKALLGL